jgi:hypothetical protein
MSHVKASGEVESVLRFRLAESPAIQKKLPEVLDNRWLVRIFISFDMNAF